MRSALAWTASCRTGSVRSLVSSILRTVIGREGDTSKPTLSHDSAKDEGASDSSLDTTLDRGSPAEADSELVDMLAVDWFRILSRLGFRLVLCPTEVMKEIEAWP